MSTLQGKVALVTGASRGIGRGVALGLGEAGATVYITGRTVEPGQAVGGLPGTLPETAEEVRRLGGQCIAVRCDHRDDAQVQAVFGRIQTEQGRLDILVNNVWGGYEHFFDGTEFWKEKGFWTAPLSRWDKMFQAGSLAHKFLFMTVGKREDDGTVSMFTELERWMGSKDLKGLAWKSARFDGVDHRSMVGKSLYDGLLFIFDGWNFPFLLVRSADIPAIEAYAAKVNARFGGLLDYKAPEWLLTEFARMWFAHGEKFHSNDSYDKAARLADLHVRLYPEHWNPYYRLGEIYTAKGDNESARKNYELAAAKNPGRTEAEKIYLQITKAKLNPSRPTARQLALYAGDYADRKVTLEKGVLIYQKADPQSQPHRLVPLTETLFAVEGDDSFWLEFVLTDGKVSALVGLYADGRRESSPRTI